MAQVQGLLGHTQQLERDVAEMRQLREEEEALTLSTIEAMAKIAQELTLLREAQGGTPGVWGQGAVGGAGGVVLGGGRGRG